MAAATSSASHRQPQSGRGAHDADTTSTLPDKRTIDELAVLYTGTLVWGAGFGFTVGLSTHGSPAAYFLPGIGMSVLGAGAVALADWKAGPLRYGVPHSVTAGLYVGLEAGLFTSIIAATRRPSGLSEGPVAGIMWGSATAGALLGGSLGHMVGTTPGRASFIETGALWGGFLTSFISAGAILDGSTDGSGPDVGLVIGTAGLLGMTAGAVTTGLLGNRFSPSIARVRFIDLGGFSGGLLAAGIYASAGGGNFSARPFFLLTALGTGVGLGVAAFLTRNMEADLPRRRADEGWIMPTFAPIPGGATAGLTGMF